MVGADEEQVLVVESLEDVADDLVASLEDLEDGIAERFHASRDVDGVLRVVVAVEAVQGPVGGREHLEDAAAALRQLPHQDARAPVQILEQVAQESLVVLVAVVEREGLLGPSDRFEGPVLVEEVLRVRLGRRQGKHRARRVDVDGIGEDDEGIQLLDLEANVPAHLDGRHGPQLEGDDHERTSATHGDDLASAGEVDRHGIATVLAHALEHQPCLGPIEPATPQPRQRRVGRAGQRRLPAPGLVGIERDLRPTEDGLPPGKTHAGGPDGIEARPAREIRCAQARQHARARSGGDGKEQRLAQRDDRVARVVDALEERRRGEPGSHLRRPHGHPAQPEPHAPHVHHAVDRAIRCAGPDEVEDAVPGGIHPGQHAGPGDRRLGRNLAPQRR